MWHKWALGAFLIGALYVWHSQYDRHASLTEAQLHQRGLWKSPKLAVDAFVVRHDPAAQRWDILMIQVHAQPVCSVYFNHCKPQRTREPYKDHWALPGGFVSWMEDPVAAVVREVAEETHLEVRVPAYIAAVVGAHHQCCQADPATAPVFVLFRGSPSRDPRTHTVRCACSVSESNGCTPTHTANTAIGTHLPCSAAYAVKVTAASLPLLQRDDDAGDVKWWSFQVRCCASQRPSPGKVHQQEASTSVPIAFDHHGMVLEFLEWFDQEGRQRGLYAQGPSMPHQ